MTASRIALSVKRSYCHNDSDPAVMSACLIFGEKVSLTVHQHASPLGIIQSPCDLCVSCFFFLMTEH